MATYTWNIPIKSQMYLNSADRVLGLRVEKKYLLIGQQHIQYKMEESRHKPKSQDTNHIYHDGRGI